MNAPVQHQLLAAQAAAPLPALSLPAGVHPALAAALAAFNQVYADYRAASDAYEAAQLAAAPFRQRPREALSSAQIAALDAEAAAYEAHALQSGGLLQAGIGLLQVDADTPAETLASVECFFASHELVYEAQRADTLAASLVQLDLEDQEMEAVLDALIRGLQKAAEPQGADAELIAIGERYRALAYEAGWIDGWTLPPWPPHVTARSEELHWEQQRLIDRSRELRAQTLAGLRTKALLAADRQPSPDFDEYTDLDWMLARSLIADVLQAPAIDMSAPERDAWHMALGIWPEDEVGGRLAEAFRSAVPQPDNAAATRDDDDLAQYDARAVLDEYRSLGGDFTYHPACGERRAMFGTMFPDTPSARSDEIEAEIAVDKRKAKLIVRELQIEARARAAQQDIEEELSAQTLESGVAA